MSLIDGPIDWAATLTIAMMDIKKAQRAEADALECLDQLARKIQEQNAFRLTYEQAYSRAVEHNPGLYELATRLRRGLAQAQIAPPNMRGGK